MEPTQVSQMKDRWNRNIQYMRISVTDHCNLRCTYCMPAQGIVWSQEKELLTDDEILAIVEAGVRLGIDRIKITGGEPFTRKGIATLIGAIKTIPGIHSVTVTTNGVELADQVEALKEAGVDSVNVNMPALDPVTYESITRRDEFYRVMDGIQRALDQGIQIRMNCVAREELTDETLLGFGKIMEHTPVDVRFIEMMPIGYGKNHHTYSNENLRQRLEALLGKKLETSTYQGNGPAVYESIPGFRGKIGWISAVNHQFCESCNRVRVTCDGQLKLCLQYPDGVNLREAAQSADPEVLFRLMEETIYDKPEKHHFEELAKEEPDGNSMAEIGG